MKNDAQKTMNNCVGIGEIVVVKSKKRIKHQF